MPYRVSLKTAVINFNSTGDNTVITAVTGRSLKVWKMYFTSTAATNITMYDGASPTTPLSGAIDLQANGTWWAQYDGVPYWETTIGNAFVMNQSGTSSIQGTIYYTAE